MLRQIGNSSSKRASIARSPMAAPLANSYVAVAILNRGGLPLMKHAPPQTVAGGDWIAYRAPNDTIELVRQDTAGSGGTQRLYVIPGDDGPGGQIPRGPQTTPLEDHGFPFI